jgi:hypothetical protein
MNPVTVYVAIVFPPLLVGVARVIVTAWREGAAK